MMSRVRILSPAKINLHLDVFPIREDGFHSILSIFQMISWYDEIEVRSLKTQDVCTIEGDFDFPQEDNIISKVHELFARETGRRDGVAFRVRKRIPRGAGLGGGSSNAASALRALDALFQTRLTSKRLMELGAMAGSDVPFFLGAAAALVSGRGEHIEVLPGRTDFWLLIVLPEVRIGTRDAYRWIDEDGLFPVRDEKRAELLSRKYRCEKPADWNFSNSFYSALRARFPEFEKIRKLLKHNGATAAAVSGSGSALFGVFSDEKNAREAGYRMKELCPIIQVARPLARRPRVVLE